MIKVPIANLSKLIQKLNYEEINFLSSKLKEYTDKRWGLFKLIQEQSKISDKQACFQLYKKEKSNAYNQLKQNLKNNVLNAMLLFYTKKPLKTKNTQASVNSKKMLLIAEILSIENMEEEATKMYKKTLQLAEEYELYDITTQAIQRLLHSSTDNVSLSEFEKYNSLLERHLELNTLQANAHILYNRLFKYARKKGSVSEFIINGKAVVEKLKSLYIKSNSTRIGSSYYRTKINIELQESNLTEALKSCEEYLELIKRSSFLNNKANIGGINMLLSNTQLRQFNYTQSETYAQVAIKSFSPRSRNQIVARRMLFFALFYQDEKDVEIIKLIENTKKLPTVKKNSFLQSKWVFFYVNWLFKQKKYDEVLDEVNDLKDLEMDKEGWLANIRVLEIVCWLEKGNYKFVDYRIEGFRAALYRNKIHTNKRLMKIYRVFKIIFNSRFNPKDEKVRLNRIARQLETDQDKLKWNISEAEVNPFHIWLKDYVSRRKAEKSILY